MAFVPVPASRSAEVEVESAVQQVRVPWMMMRLPQLTTWPGTVRASGELSWAARLSGGHGGRLYVVWTISVRVRRWPVSRGASVTVGTSGTIPEPEPEAKLGSGHPARVYPYASADAQGADNIDGT